MNPIAYRCVTDLKGAERSDKVRRNPVKAGHEAKGAVQRQKKKDNRTKKTYVTVDFESYEYTYIDGSDYTDGGNNITISGEYWKYEYDLLNRLDAVYKYNQETEEVELIKSYRFNGANYRVESTKSH